MKGKISEIFESIQGEGVYVGERQIFVRFHGCNLSCKFCDTRLGYFSEYEPQEVFDRIMEYPPRYHSVSFTGGEPLLQKVFLKELLPLTREARILNYLETNGTLPEALSEVIDYVDIVAMDLKLPTSTDSGAFWDEHRRFLAIALQKEAFIKTVICKSTVAEDIRHSLRVIKANVKNVALILQPNTAELDDELEEKMKRFRKLCLESGVKTLIVPQVHKILGVT